MPDPTVFARTLRTLREAAGWSVPELARRAGLARTQVYAIEDGTRRPSWDTVQAIAAAFGVPTDTFRDPPSEARP